ncbi:MAG: ATP-binding cassette domain-containing protein, partial [Luteolibacter sp.]
MSLVIENLVLPLAEFTLSVDVKLAATVTGLTGPSGAGKTSLLELIAGLRRPQQGSISLDGEKLTDTASRHFLAPEKRRVGYVPQDLALFPHLNVLSNLRYGLRHDDHLLEKVIAILELSTLAKRGIASLSGGEKQRVALGRALLAGPKILLLDEPLSN